MKIIKNSITTEYIIQKSKFITKLYHVNNEEEITSILKQLKIEFKDATHICYGYIIDNVKRFQDDGEPSGTAGMPILNVIEQQNLNMILAVVIRYFGGIKLGAGGLVRAYSNAVSKALNETDIKDLLEGMEIEISLNYEDLKIIELLLKEETIINKTFDEKIIITFQTTISDYNKLKNNIQKYNPIIKKEHLYIIR